MNGETRYGRSLIAVTGANGFVGRHLVAHLHSRQMPALPLSRHPSPTGDGRVVSNYADTASLAQALSGADAVIHLAARAHQRDTPDSARAYQEANIDTTQALARACRSAGVRRLVFVSSIGVNGNKTNGTPFSEADAPAPVEPYAVSKCIAEDRVRAELAQGETDYVILRPPLVYGPGCPGNFGQLMRWAAKAPALPLGGIRAPRRFIYVGNLVQALVVATHHPAASRRTFLLGDGRDLSVAEILSTALSALGRSSQVLWHVPPKLLRVCALLMGRGETFDKLASPLQVDPREFTRVTGWAPHIDPTEGLILTAKAFQSS